MTEHSQKALFTVWLHVKSISLREFRELFFFVEDVLYFDVSLTVFLDMFTEVSKNFSG